MVKSLSSVESAKRVVASGWMEGSVAWRETLHGRRNANRCDSEKWLSGFTTEVFLGPGQGARQKMDA